MTVNITINASSMEELAKDLQALGVDVSLTLPVGAEVSDVAQVVGGKDLTPEAKAPTEPALAKRNSRKTKETPAETKALAPAADAEQQALAQQKDEAEQDAADEAAETAASNPGKELTLDDLRKAMTDYAAAYGMPAAATDRNAIFEKALGKPPSGDAWSFKLFDPIAAEFSEGAHVRLADAIAGWKKATQENLFKHERI